MKRLLLFAGLLLTVASQAQTWKSFTDTAGKFKARYPDNWVNKIKEGNRVFFTSPAENNADQFRQNVNINVSESDDLKGTKIRSLVPDLQKSVESQYEGYKFIAGKYFTWNGIESYEFDYSITQPSVDFRIRITQWMTIKNGAIYMATYTAPEDADAMRDTALKILKSITF